MPICRDPPRPPQSTPWSSSSLRHTLVPASGSLEAENLAEAGLLCLLCGGVTVLKRQDEANAVLKDLFYPLARLGGTFGVFDGMYGVSGHVALVDAVSPSSSRSRPSAAVGWKRHASTYFGRAHARVHLIAEEIIPAARADPRVGF